MICPLMMLRFSLPLSKLGEILSRLVTTNLKVGSLCPEVCVQLVSTMATSLVDGGA